MTRARSTNQDQSAVDAAAERLLGDLRSKRVAAAEQALASASERLARAQAGEQASARALALHDFPGNRQRVLEARQDVEIATSLRDDAERELEKARQRHSPEVRKAAEEYVRLSREATAFRDSVEPILAAITERCAAVVLLVRQMLDATSRAHGVRMRLRHAAESCGLALDPHAFHISDPKLLISDAVLKACKSEGFFPHDFRELVDPVPASAPPIMAIPGAQAVPESIEDFKVRRAAVEARMAAQERATLAGGER